MVAIIGSVLLALSIYLCYAFSDRLGRILGATGMTVIMQLTSFLLVCIGVQIFWNGAKVLLGFPAAPYPVNIGVGLRKYYGVCVAARSPSEGKWNKLWESTGYSSHLR